MEIVITVGSWATLLKMSVENGHFLPLPLKVYGLGHLVGFCLAAAHIFQEMHEK